MSDERPREGKKPKKRYLLTAVALSTGSMMVGCGSQQGEGEPGSGAQGEVREVEPVPLPANPKGAVYDDGLTGTNDPEPEQPIEPVPPEEVQPEPPPPPPEEARPPQKVRPLPLPANPKGALYDHGAYRTGDDDEA